jgi:tRNA(adenine34) deaminase
MLRIQALLLTDFYQRIFVRSAKKIKEFKSRKRASVIVIHNDSILTFLGRDPTSKREYFFLPGGSIEPNESPIQTAIRECYEETGYQAEVFLSPKKLKKYFFEWDGKLHLCETHFFKGKLKSSFENPKQVKDAKYNLGVVWVPINQIKSAFAYDKVIQKVVELFCRQ